MSGDTSASDLKPDHWNARFLTHEQARMEQHLYWSTKTVEERLAASWELTKDLYLLRGIDLDQQEPGWNPRWVSRSRR